jgi:hypothetical protein
LCLEKEIDGCRLGDCLKFDVQFLEADIDIDAILSFPWLSQNRIGVFPHHKALDIDEPRLTFFMASEDKIKKNPKCCSYPH